MSQPKNDSLELLHADMARANMAPTWVHVSEFVSKTPTVSYRPWMWRWDDVIPLLMRAGDLITPERGAERRSMEHVNPDLKKFYCTSHTIATAFQLVKAGERAPAHRHAASAVRFAARSQGGDVFTQVQGEPLHMEENDLLLTPAWMWHEHKNNTKSDIIWLDALDFPLVNLLQASLFEPGEGETNTPRDAGYTAQNLGLYRPVDQPYPESHPVMRYPWVDMHKALDGRRKEEGSPFDDLILEYVNPLTSGPTLPTISCRAQLIRKGKHTRAQRATASKVYFVVAGKGRTVIDGIGFEWGRGDVFVVPNWSWHEHIVDSEDCFLFSITDVPTMSLLGLYRHEAYQEADGHQAKSSQFRPV
jgi:gentisate 1,2-dioxygenase